MDITGMEVWCSADGKHFTKVAESSKPVLKKDDPDGISVVCFSRHNNLCLKYGIAVYSERFLIKL